MAKTGAVARLMHGAALLMYYRNILILLPAYVQLPEAGDMKLNQLVYLPGVSTNHISGNTIERVANILDRALWTNYFGATFIIDIFSLHI